MKKIFILLFLFCGLFTQAQKKVNTDSLIKLLPSLKGEKRINTLNQIGWELKFSKPAEA